ncbi:MAG: queuosine precursor transporter [Legionellales bacterium]|nr:queuosine precursor transporter [Legionellales bacterium]
MKSLSKAIFEQKNIAIRGKPNAGVKYYPLLAMLYTTLLILSVLLDYKFIKIDQMLASAATFVISSTFFLNDIIAEIYGYQRARYVIWSSLLCLMLFSIVGFILNNIKTPEEYLQYGKAYNTVLQLLFRAGLSNAIAIVLGSFINVYIVSKWKIILRGRYFWLRSLCASIVGEVIYTTFVVTLLNIGIVNFYQLMQILFVSLSFKLLFDVIAIVPANIFANFLKRKEQIDIYDYGLSLNPFKFNINSELISENEFNNSRDMV